MEHMCVCVLLYYMFYGFYLFFTPKGKTGRNGFENLVFLT